MAESHVERGGHSGGGREAQRPGEVLRRNWRAILPRVKNDFREHNLALVAAGVAFYWLLAIFPALAALVSIFGLAADPEQVRQQIQALQFLPAEAKGLLVQEASGIAGGSGTGLGLGLVLGILLALLSAGKGIKSLIKALNIVYDEQEERGFFKLNGLALLMTTGGVLLAIIAIALVVIVPPALGAIGLSAGARWTISLVRWPVLLAAVMFGLAVVYRYAPSRRAAKWRWVSPGSLAATVLWIAASIGFSIYVAQFGNYDKTYGSLGAVIILLLWFWVTALVVLFGGEINAQTELQTRHDTTRGDDRPMGRRGARVADTVSDTL